MKKIAIILILFMFFLVGCNKKDNKTTEQKIVTNIKYIKHTFESAIKNSQFIYIGKLKSVNSGSNILDNKETMSYDVRANYKVYTFTISNTLYQSYSINKEEVNVYSERKISFNYDEEYFLPLSLINYPFMTEDVFSINGAMQLSLDNPNKNTINETDKIVDANGIDYSITIDRDAMINYVETLDKDKLPYYYRETNSQTIIENSPNVFKIKVGELSFTRKSDYSDGEAYSIEIIEIIKGTKIGDAEEYKIEFPKGLVKKGDVVYVGTEFIGRKVIDSGLFYNLTSITLLTEDDFNK